MPRSPRQKSWFVLLGVIPVLWALTISRSSAESPMVLAGIDGDSDHAEPVEVAARELDLASIFDPDVDLGVEVSLYAENLRERITVRLPLSVDGVSEDVLDQLSSLLRCHRTGRKHKVDPNLVSALAMVAKEYPGHEIEIVSGYRARPYGVPGSRHFRGEALDFRVIGVPLSEVRDYVWHNMEHVGLGHYHTKGMRKGFLHLDVRPREKVGWDQRREGRPYRYGPAWARASS